MKNISLLLDWPELKSKSLSWMTLPSALKSGSLTDFNKKILPPPHLSLSWPLRITIQLLIQRSPRHQPLTKGRLAAQSIAKAIY
jgi:hypothetical protein